MSKLSDRLYATTDYRRFVADALQVLGLKQRDLARALGRTDPWLSLVLSRDRTLDPELVEPIATYFELEADESAYFAAMVDLDSKSPRARRTAWATVHATQRHRAQAGEYDEDIAIASSRWYFGAILELAQCQGFRPDPRWIAGTLVPPITEQQAEEALTTAVRLGRLAPDEHGGLAPANVDNWSPSEIPPGTASVQVATLHRAVTELAADALTRFRSNERHISTTTAAVSEEQYAKIVARLREVEREVVLLAMEPSEKNRVYHLALYWFPISLYSDSTADHSMWVSSQGPPPDIDPDTTE